MKKMLKMLKRWKMWRKSIKCGEKVEIGKYHENVRNVLKFEKNIENVEMC